MPGENKDQSTEKQKSQQEVKKLQEGVHRPTQEPENSVRPSQRNDSATTQDQDTSKGK